MYMNNTTIFLITNRVRVSQSASQVLLRQNSQLSVRERELRLIYP